MDKERYKEHDKNRYNEQGNERDNERDKEQGEERDKEQDNGRDKHQHKEQDKNRHEEWDEEYKKMWDLRYLQDGYAYGKEPNDFFKEQLQRLKPGSILMPADGEGRNGVFAAKLGWKVTATDLSTEGRHKALQLAEENGVTGEYDYIVGDLEELDHEKESFDAIGLIYAHFAAGKKSACHRQLDGYLKSGGMIIFEAFTKDHIHLKKEDPRVGGPGDVDMLFSKEEILADFPNYEILLLEDVESFLEEGRYHMGKGAVLRYMGRKK